MALIYKVLFLSISTFETPPRDVLHHDRGPLLGWIHNHIGHLTPLIHRLVPGRVGLIIGDAAHDYRGRGDRHGTERGSRDRRTNDRASDRPARIGSTGIIPSIAIAVPMVIIGPVLPIFLPLLSVALPTFLPLLGGALPVFAISCLVRLPTGLHFLGCTLATRLSFLGRGLTAGLHIGTTCLSFLGRGLTA